MNGHKHLPDAARSALTGAENDRYEIDAGACLPVGQLFSGLPAIVAGPTMMGLDREAPAECMLGMNCRNERGRAHRWRLDPPSLDVDEIIGLRWR
jgi:hypothetical protein